MSYRILFSGIERPLESILFHAFHPQCKAITFPIHALHDGAVVISEDEQPGAEEIKLHLGFDNGDQTIDGFPYIHWLTVQIDCAAITLGSKHTQARNPASNRAMVSGSTGLKYSSTEPQGNIKRHCTVDELVFVFGVEVEASLTSVKLEALLIK